MIARNRRRLSGRRASLGHDRRALRGRRQLAGATRRAARAAIWATSFGVPPTCFVWIRSAMTRRAACWARPSTG